MPRTFFDPLARPFTVEPSPRRAKPSSAGLARSVRSRARSRNRCAHQTAVGPPRRTSRPSSRPSCRQARRPRRRRLMAEYYDADYSDHSSSTVAVPPAARRRTTPAAARRLSRSLLRTADPAPRLLPAALRTAAGEAVRANTGFWVLRRHLAVARHGAAGGTGGDRAVSFAEVERVDGWRSTPNRSSASPKRWAAKSRCSTNCREGRARTRRVHRRCTWKLDGTVRAWCASPRWTVPARQAARFGTTAKTLRGLKLVTVWTAETRNADMRSPNATPGRSMLQRRGRERGQPPHRPAAFPVQRNGRIAKLSAAAASTPRRDASSSATGPSGSGIWPPNTVPRRHRNRRHLPCQGASDAMSPRPSTAPARTWPPSGARIRRDELDAGRFDAILTALRAHRETCEEAFASVI